MRTSEELKNVLIREALVEEQTEWFGFNGHYLRSFNVARYIWRSEDLHEYRVAIGENLNTELTNRRHYDDIATRYLTYIPTGRIMYDNTVPHKQAVLFEYRLKESRELIK